MHPIPEIRTILTTANHQISTKSAFPDTVLLRSFVNALFLLPMSDTQSSAFGRFAEWASGQMILVGFASTTLSLVATACGLGNSRALYVLCGLMFLLAQVFIVRWMFGLGMRSIKDLGFGSNRQAMKYLFFMKGLDWRISAVAVYALCAALLLAVTGLAKTAGAAFLLCFLTCGTVSQAMRLNRFWPNDPSRH